MWRVAGCHVFEGFGLCAPGNCAGDSTTLLVLARRGDGDLKSLLASTMGPSPGGGRVDAADLKSADRKVIPVQIRARAPKTTEPFAKRMLRGH